MAIATVGELIRELRKHDRSLPVKALDEGSPTRGFVVFKITHVEEGSVGSGENPPAAVLVEVRPVS